MKAKFLFGFVFIVFALPSANAKFYKYNELQIKNYDKMLEHVQENIRKSRELSMANQSEEDEEDSPSDQEAIETLRETAKFVLSRPNKDNMVSKLMPAIRRELNNYSAFEDTLASLTSEAINALGNSKIKVTYRATYLFVLENLMSEIRPQAIDSDELYGIIKKIRDANIEVSKDVRLDRKLKSMYETKSPSDTAKELLVAIDKRRVIEAQREAAEKAKEAKGGE